MQTQDQISNSFRPVASSPTARSSNASGSFISKKRRMQGNAPTLTHFIDQIDPAQIVDLNKTLVQFLISSNLNFAILNNPFLQEFLKKLRPSYQLPSRDKFSEIVKVLSREKKLIIL